MGKIIETKYSKKGYVYTIEALIAIALILIATVIIFGISQTPSSSSLSLAKKQGFDAMEFLDQNDELRLLVAVGNKNDLKNRLKDLLPPGITLDVDICRYDCTANTPANKNVVSLDYYISGYHDTFFMKKVKIWMWGSF
jgi:hypothetical protein